MGSADGSGTTQSSPRSPRSSKSRRSNTMQSSYTRRTMPWCPLCIFILCMILYGSSSRWPGDGRSFSRPNGRTSPYSRPVYLSEPAPMDVNAPCQIARSSLIEACECPENATALRNFDSAFVTSPLSCPQTQSQWHVPLSGGCCR